MAMSCPISRRRFCAGAGAGLLSLHLPGCFGSSSGFYVSPGDDGGGGDDLAVRPGADLARDLSQPPDLVTPASDLAKCPVDGMLAGGNASSLELNQARFFRNANGDFFVCRDASGI